MISHRKIKLVQKPKAVGAYRPDRGFTHQISDLATPSHASSIVLGPKGSFSAVSASEMETLLQAVFRKQPGAR
jgi:hypothetical protein